MLAIHFGAGNIGRGFIGNLLHQSGYEICFVDVNRKIVDLINERKTYTIGLASDSNEEIVVKNIYAIHSGDHPKQVVSAIGDADLVTTAVGPHVLPLIAGLIAEGLKKRLENGAKPLNIIACENMIGGSALLKKEVYRKLGEEERKSLDPIVGFPNAAVDRIVPNQSHPDPLKVVVEPFYEWVVDRSQVVGELDVKGMTLVDDLMPYIERKLYTVNTGHAAAAYFGYQAGRQTIDEAMKDPDIRNHVKNTLQETGSLLVEKHGFKQEEHQAYIKTIIQRFVNPHISDDVTRVGRSPLRKLGPKDRLVSPATQYITYLKKQPVYLSKVIAAALRYDNKKDPDAVKIQESIEQKGLEKTIHEITQIPQDSDLMKNIVEHYRHFTL